MKSFLAITLCTLCYACFPANEIQGEMVDATLIKIVEVHRFPNVKLKIFTWKTDRDLSFITSERGSVYIPIGTHTKVLVYR